MHDGELGVRAGLRRRLLAGDRDSPEVLIFLFFMITDPKTVPAGQVGRVMFGLLVAIACVLLMAPQTDEWWTKVGLLSGLVLVCASGPCSTGRSPNRSRPPTTCERSLSHLALLGAAIAVGTVLLVGAGIVLAGTPARGVVVRDTAASLDGVPVAIDPATLPEITVSEDVVSFDHELAGPGMQAVLVTLAENLELENEASAGTTSRSSPRSITAIASTRCAAARDGARVGPADPLPVRSIDVSLLVPFGQQTGLSLGLLGRGTKVEEVYDSAGAPRAAPSRRSRRRSRCAARPAIAGSTSRCCRRSRVAVGRGAPAEAGARTRSLDLAQAARIDLVDQAVHRHVLDPRVLRIRSTCAAGSSRGPGRRKSRSTSAPVLCTSSR